jgi:hypothetical protein
MQRIERKAQRTAERGSAGSVTFEFKMRDQQC